MDLWQAESGLHAETAMTLEPIRQFSSRLCPYHTSEYNLVCAITSNVYPECVPFTFHLVRDQHSKHLVAVDTHAEAGCPYRGGKSLQKNEQLIIIERMLSLVLEVVVLSQLTVAHVKELRERNFQSGHSSIYSS